MAFSIGHADGYVAFLDDNTLLVADYGDGKYDELEGILQDCFPDTNIIQLESYKDNEGKYTKFIFTCFS